MAHHDDKYGVPLSGKLAPYPRAPKWAVIRIPARRGPSAKNGQRLSLPSGWYLNIASVLRCQILDTPSFIAGFLPDPLAEDDGMPSSRVAQSRIGLSKAYSAFQKVLEFIPCPGYMERTELAVALIVRHGQVGLQLNKCLDRQAQWLLPKTLSTRR
jgi:hypothetical protein